MYRYVSGPLSGDFSKHIMSAKRWGVPAELKEKGIAPLYTSEHDAGWDGQFYFYMSNDLLAQKDASKHIDSDAYRYQRIGLPLFAKVLSVLTLQSWVSTQTYYASSFILILLAVLIGGYYFAQNNVSPLWMLPWSLGAGTQLTLLNGLPDAAADAFFIVALVACVSRKYWIYGMAMSFAVLSREAYILFGAIFFAGMVWVQFKNKEHQFRLKDWLLCSLPIVLFACWHLFVRHHFDNTPASQSAQVLGFPLQSTFSHMFAGLSGHYPGLPDGANSVQHGMNIFFYLALILSTFAAAIKFKPLRKLKFENLLPTAIALFLCGLIGLYLSFGDTVMWHFSGYMKAANLFLFLWPFFLLLSGKKIHKLHGFFLLFLTLFFGKQAWDFRVNQQAIVPLNAEAICANANDTNNKKCTRRWVYQAKQLPATLGDVVGAERTASIKDGEGFLIYGPYIKLEGGLYKFKLSFSGASEHGKSVLGHWEIGRFAPAPSVEVFYKANLLSGDDTYTEINVHIPEKGIESLEVRAWFGGSGSLTVKKIEIEKIN